MNIESILPFLLIIGLFVFAFFAEGVVLYFFKVKHFWASIGTSFVVNILSLLVLYACASLVGKLGYELNGLRLPVQVTLFFWWVSVFADALLVQWFAPKTETHRIYLASVVMNSLSYLFLYFFIANSH